MYHPQLQVLVSLEKHWAIWILKDYGESFFAYNARPTFAIESSARKSCSWPGSNSKCKGWTAAFSLSAFFGGTISSIFDNYGYNLLASISYIIKLLGRTFSLSIGNLQKGQIGGFFRSFKQILHKVWWLLQAYIGLWSVRS